MTSAEKYLKEYLDYLEIEKNRSPLTRGNYERYLTAFFTHANINSLNDITESSIRNFRLSLAREKKGTGGTLKKSTQSYYVIAIRNFLKFLVKRGVETVPPETIELPKIPSRQIEILEYKELERLLDAPDGADLKGLRDKAILELFFSTGLRLSELCALNRFTDFGGGELSIRGKGEKLRVVFLSNTARDAIKTYLKKRTDAEEALFISITRAKAPKVIGRITPRAIQRLINFYTTKAGISSRVTPHQLRHLFATDLLMNGADLRSVQELLGHANVSTTQIYTHVTNKALKEIHRAFHGKKRD